MVEIRWRDLKNVGYSRSFTDVSDAYHFIMMKQRHGRLGQITSIEAYRKKYSILGFIDKYVIESKSK